MDPGALEIHQRVIRALLVQLEKEQTSLLISTGLT
jgi:hypothetical protein